VPFYCGMHLRASDCPVCEIDAACFRLGQAKGQNDLSRFIKLSGLSRRPCRSWLPAPSTGTGSWMDSRTRAARAPWCIAGGAL